MDRLSNACCNDDDLPTFSLEYVYAEVVFGGFVVVCIVWEFVVAVGEFNELCALC